MQQDSREHDKSKSMVSIPATPQLVVEDQPSWILREKRPKFEAIVLYECRWKVRLIREKDANRAPRTAK
jgi:hypothetical protein